MFLRKDNTLAYPESQTKRTQSLDRMVGAFFLLKHATGMFLTTGAKGTSSALLRSQYSACPESQVKRHKASIERSGLFSC